MKIKTKSLILSIIYSAGYKAKLRQPAKYICNKDIMISKWL